MPKHEINVTVSLIPNFTMKHHIKIQSDTPLLCILQIWAEQAGQLLLPNRDTPLDRLHNIEKHDKIGLAINDIDKTIGEFLEQDGITHNFGVELLRLFRVNNQWFIADKEYLTPKDILTIANLNHQEYSLYRGQSADLLPPDTSIQVERGNIFEAQRDGKYGGHH